MATEINQIKTAINAFKLQYDALPGDMSDSDQYWAEAINPGDGNGKFGYPSETSETINVWQHLSLSKIYPGNYTGWPNAAPFLESGVTVPAANIYTGVYYMTYELGNDTFGIAGNTIRLGGIDDNTLKAQKAALTPKDAESIDKKIDDGIAWKGKIVFRNGYYPPNTTNDCVDNGTTAPSNYRRDVTTVQCRMNAFID